MFTISNLETSLDQAKKVCEEVSTKLKTAAKKLSTSHLDCTDKCCDPKLDNNPTE